MQSKTHETKHHEAHGGHDHHEPSFLQKYVFSTDHKVIGIQYGLTALLFLLLGYSLMGLMRWQIAHPGMPVPFVGGLLHNLLGDAMAPVMKDGNLLGYAISADLYNSFGAMHGTIM